MSKKTYAALEAELQEVIESLSGDGTDVDQAMQLYKKGMELAKEIEAKLGDAQLQVRELKAAFKA